MTQMSKTGLSNSMTNKSEIGIAKDSLDISKATLPKLSGIEKEKDFSKQAPEINKSGEFKPDASSSLKGLKDDELKAILSELSEKFKGKDLLKDLVVPPKNKEKQPKTDKALEWPDNTTPAKG